MRCRGAAAAVALVATVWLPGIGGAQERRAAVASVPAPALERARSGVSPGAAGGAAAEARRRVLDELEELQGEIGLLRALKDAQDALLGWNKLLVQSGRKPVGLDEALCRRAGAWCVALPASFGHRNEKGSG